MRVKIGIAPATVLILKFGTQDFTDPGLLKIRLNLWFVFVVLPSQELQVKTERSHFRLTSVAENCLRLSSLIARSGHVFRGEVDCSQTSIFP